MTAQTEDTASCFTPLFPQDDVPRILNALLDACVGLQKKCDTEIENRITFCLWQRARRHEPFRDGPLHITCQAPVVDSDVDRDTPEGQVDLQVICFRGPDVYFAIEAKRLRVRYPFGRLEHGAVEYTEDGMMRFVTGQYAPRMKSGAMLGYVFDGNVSAARDSISKAIEKRREMLRLSEGLGLRRSPILPTRSVDETVHEPVKRELILYHVLVSV